MAEREKVPRPAPSGRGRPPDYDRAHYVELARKVAHDSRVDAGKVLSGSRLREVVAVRHEVWLILRGLDPPWTYSRIARAARVDHTTVLYAEAKARGAKEG